MKKYKYFIGDNPMINCIAFYSFMIINLIFILLLSYVLVSLFFNQKTTLYYLCIIILAFLMDMFVTASNVFVSKKYWAVDESRVYYSLGEKLSIRKKILWCFAYFFFIKETPPHSFKIEEIKDIALSYHPQETLYGFTSYIVLIQFHLKNNTSIQLSSLTEEKSLYYILKELKEKDILINDPQGLFKMMENTILPLNQQIHFREVHR